LKREKEAPDLTKPEMPSRKRLADVFRHIGWRLVSVPIYVKVFGIGLLISLLFASIAYYVMRNSVLQAHYQARGEMAVSLALSLATRIQSGDINEKAALDKDLNEIMAAFPSVRYVLVQDPQGKILSHGFTFPKEAPADLTKQGGDLCASCHNGLSPEVLPAQLLEVPSNMSLPEGSLRAYHRNEGLILEARAPVGGGQLGSVRLGVADKMVANNLAVINRSILAGIALCLIATLCSAMLLTFVLNKPIHGLLKATKIVAEGNFDARAPVFSNDELGRLACAFNQMTERLAESRRRILRADRLASIGQFAVGVAHEINNPLDGVLSCLQRLQREPANLSQNLKYFDMIKHALLRIAGVIQRLLEYSQQREMNRRPEDVHAIVNNVVALLHVMAHQNEVDIESDIEDDLPQVACDQHYIEQVLLNLALNGLAAMETNNGHNPPIARGNLKFSASAAQSSGATPFVRIDVADTGSGIATEHLDKIFEAFFTTKEEGKGTGLGLAIAREIIEDHSGFIEVESFPGQGTVFHVFLPVWDPHAKNSYNEGVAAE
jgi:signal transduction histidine kinase